MRQKLMSHRSQNRSANRELPPIKHKPMTFSPPTRFFSDPRINKSQNEAEPQPMIKRKVRVRIKICSLIPAWFLQQSIGIENQLYKTEERTNAKAVHNQLIFAGQS